MWLGVHHHFPTPSCCLAASMMQHSLLLRLCQVLRSGQVFTFSLLQVEEPLHCVTIDGGPAGFLTKTRLWWSEDRMIIMSQGAGIKTVFLHRNILNNKIFSFMASPSPVLIETPSALTLSQVQYKWLCRGTSPTARKQICPRLCCSSFHQGETWQTTGCLKKVY